MLNIDVSSDIDAAIAGVGEFFRRQVPYATSVAINNSIFDVRWSTVNETWPKAFKVRNRALPGKMFNVSQKASKGSLVAVLSQGLDRDFVERQAVGGVKVGRSGGRVAIPAAPEKVRNATGSVKASLKPLRLEGKPRIIVIGKKGGKQFILKTTRGARKRELIYSIVPSARIPKRFNFYEDGTATSIRVFPGYWRLAMNAAIATSRFTPK